MIWFPLLAACLHPPPQGPTPAARALEIHPEIVVETKRSLVGFSLLIEGGSSTDVPVKAGAGALLWSALSTHPALEQWKEAGGQVRSEWNRDYGALHYRWQASEDLQGLLTRVLQDQFAADGGAMDWEQALGDTRNDWNREEGDRGLPELRDAWLATGLEGHPYAHPTQGTARTRSVLTVSDLKASFEDNLCTGRIHTAWSSQTTPTLPEGIRTLLNELGPCSSELPTPKPLPFSSEERLLVLESRGSGTQAFVALPHRKTSRPLDADSLQWAAALLLGPSQNGPLARELQRAGIEASISARTSPRGERWRQPLLQVELRTQDAEPIALLKALRATLQNLSLHGFSPRDVHRLRSHLEHLPEASSTSPRLESLLLAEVFGPSPSAAVDHDAAALLEFLHQGLSLQAPFIVMEVADAAEVERYAQDQGIAVRVLRAEEIEVVPTD